MWNAIRLAVVLPCFNEGESIRYAVDELRAVFSDLIAEGLINESSFLLFVDDGSHDDTWAHIISVHNSLPFVKGLKLSRNFGHQAALLAGLHAVANQCDAVVSIDADLQQDPAAIREFILSYRDGCEVVLGIRRDRQTDSGFKRWTAWGFYRLMNVLGVAAVENHADYRLLGSKALGALKEYAEPSVFLRAICLQLGFKSSTVFFDVKERRFGETKYSLVKMLRLAVHGITAHSVVPLRLVAIIGFAVFMLSVMMAVYVLWSAVVVGGTVPGWASTALPIYFIGGIQLLCMAIVGEYVGQIYSTVKGRPRWIVECSCE